MKSPKYRAYMLVGASFVLGFIFFFIILVVLSNGTHGTQSTKAGSTTWQIDENSLIHSASSSPEATMSTSTPSGIILKESAEKKSDTEKKVQEDHKVILEEKQPDKVVSTSTGLVKSYPFSAKEMLSAHNLIRKSVGIGNLIWSDTLSQSAKKWSEILKSEKCVMRHDLNSPYGENIYWAWTSGDANGKSLISKPSEAVNMWAAESKVYNYEKNTCKTGEQCGHYTQVVWKDTTEVGCGVSSCITGDAQTDVWVCRYSPAGNNGSRPY